MEISGWVWAACASRLTITSKPSRSDLETAPQTDGSAHTFLSGMVKSIASRSWFPQLMAAPFDKAATA
jgi:hypothetical protein